MKYGNIPGPEAGIWESQSDRSFCNYRIPHDHRACRVSISSAYLQLACIKETIIENEDVSYPRFEKWTRLYDVTIRDARPIRSLKSEF